MRTHTIFNFRQIASGKWLVSFCLLVAFQLPGLSGFAQSKKVEGFVTDSIGTPLEQVSVSVKGSRTGTTTDSKGHYAITVNDNAILVFSFSGYNSKEEMVGPRSLINLSLSGSPKALDEVVVIGYGTQRKVNLSGAVAVMSGKDLVNRPVPNVTAALQGQLPGVTVFRGSGKPGDEGYGIRIRGFSGVPTGVTGAGVKALTLVDGVEQDINLIDPSDVESISVLKDASASSIYGARAANGVILVTTKKGTGGKARVNISSSYGINITARQPQRLNSWDEQILIDEARFNA
ncbi:MAG TPA: TonB-dependent receptor plug domain-containing protein, partial [Chitinophagaceae bacterium]|nr:TonB-dependent receptor plug domain-containing protein [Chitinophagaceae bacterium]